MKLSLGEVASCLSGQTVITPRRPTELTGNLLKRNGLISVLAERGWEELTALSAQIDSREKKPGSLFFCFKGENSDGHLYAADAVKNGAVAVIGTEDPFAKERFSGQRTLPPVFIVADTLEALWRLALLQRSETKAQVIGITGTAGKTTVKETLATVLELAGETEKNHKNHNTQIGLSMSMVNASLDASFWVFEAGISHEHDMAELGSILQPDVSLIVNAAEAHAEGLGKQGVAWHKAQLAAYTTNNGMAFGNADFPALVSELEKLRPELQQRNIGLRYFSSADDSAACTAKFRSISEKATGLGVFTVSVDGENFDVEAPFIGAYGAENVAAVVAVARHAGMQADRIAEGLKKVVLPDQRFVRVEVGSTTIIDDTYNANPLSAGRMAQAAAQLAETKGRALVFVMGMMGELGPEEAALHETLGHTLGKTMPRAVFWKGKFADEVKKGLDAAGFAGEFALVTDQADFANKIQGKDFSESIVLFKGSRSNYLETFVAAFKNALHNARVC